MTGDDQVKVVKKLSLFFVMAGAAGIVVSIVMAASLWGGQPGTWTLTGNLNQARVGHTATVLPNGTVLIVGGNDASGRAMATAELFDPATGQYVQVPAPLPVPVSGHTATLLKNGTVLIAGGVAESGTPIGFAQVFDPATGTFSGPKLMAVPRSEHTATLLTKDGWVLISGGTDGSAPLADLELYDPASDSFSRVPTTLQVARRSHTAALLDDGTVLFAGGSGPAGALSSAELYNPADNTVVAVGSLNTPRTQASAALLLDGTVFMAGGKNSQDQDLNSAEIYDPPTKSFTQLAAMMTMPRSGHVGVTLQDNGKVLLLGGTNAGQLITSVELYDPVTGTFRTVGAPATARTRAAVNFFAVPYTGGMLGSGGQDANQNPLASSELFSYPTLRTDKQDYPPGYVVRMMGEGWQPNEEISILIHETRNPDFTMEITADASGAFAFDGFQIQSKDIGMSFLATASGSQTNWTAQARFTDAAAILDQCRNGTISSPVQCAGDGSGASGWVNGDANPNQAHWREGESLPYRMRLSGLSSGSHTLTIEWDTTKGGKHAIDHLTTYNRTETTADPCSTVTGCGSPTTFPIPTDTNVTGLGVSQVPGLFTCFNCTITSVGVSLFYTRSGSYSGDSSTRITLTFTAANSTPVIAWSGHIASQFDWGAGNSAISIPGSPYRMRLIDLDGSGGNQDRALAAAAVVGPPTITTQVSPTTISVVESVTDTATLSGSNGPVTGWVNFILCGPASSPPDCTTGVTEVFHLVPIDPITGKAATPLLRIEEPGTFCFRADYIPDATAPYAAGSHTDTTNECFTVTKTTLTVNKVVVPSSDTGLFNLQIDGVTDTPPTGGVGNGGTTGPVVVSPGSHTVGETAGTNTSLSDYISKVECDSGKGAADPATSLPIDLAAGDQVTCTITNTKQPTLTVTKVLDLPTDPGKFDLQIDGVTKTPPGGVGNGGTTGPVVVSIGTQHSVGEQASTGTNTSLSDYSTVIGGDCAANGSITLAAGDNKTCTITNTRKGTIVIIKTTVNGSATFSYTGTGSGIPPSFTIPPSQTFSGLTTGAAGGSRSVTEPVLLLPTGWVFDNLGCTSALGTSTVTPATPTSSTQTATISTLGAGDTVTCTYTNALPEFDVTVTKVTNPSGSSTSFPFTAAGDCGFTSSFSLTGQSGSNTRPGTCLNMSTVSFTETVPSGWQNPPSAVCNGQPYTPGTPITVTGPVACTFTNTLLGQATRTLGFWATHLELARITLGGTAIDLTCRSVDNIGKLEGGFWSSISFQSDGKTRRSDLDQARMQLVQQLLAAILNVRAFGTFDGGLIATAERNSCDQTSSRDAILGSASLLDAFNQSGSTVTPPGFIPLQVDPRRAQSIADKAYWDSLQ